jgi:hypothetical protein
MVHNLRTTGSFFLQGWTDASRWSRLDAIDRRQPRSVGDRRQVVARESKPSMPRGPAHLRRIVPLRGMVGNRDLVEGVAVLPYPDGKATSVSGNRPAVTGAAPYPLPHPTARASRGPTTKHPVTLADDTDDGFPEEEPFTFTCGPDERLSIPLRSRINQQITAVGRPASRPADRCARRPTPGRRSPGCGRRSDTRLQHTG